MAAAAEAAEAAGDSGALPDVLDFVLSCRDLGACVRLCWSIEGAPVDAARAECKQTKERAVEKFRTQVCDALIGSHSAPRMVG